MRAVLQRVRRAAVRVDGRTVGSIGHGLVAFVGVGLADDAAAASALARRVVELRIFADESGRTNRSIAEVRGAVLVVSQFTLYADLEHGRRPGFSRAAPPNVARGLYEAFCDELVVLGIPVERGVFGAAMEVELVNEGPFTLWLDIAR